MKILTEVEMTQVNGGGLRKELAKKAVEYGKKAVKWAANTAAGAAATEVAKSAYNGVRRRINRAPEGTDCGTRNDPCG